MVGLHEADPVLGGRAEPGQSDNALVNLAGQGWGGGRRRRAAVIAAIVAYALAAAVCRPLTDAALGAVLVAGVPLFSVGVLRRPRRAKPVSGASAAVWLGVGGLAGALELVVFLGPDDAAHPTLSLLADPLLNTYPGRVLGYVVWIVAGLWLVTR
jgi:hypothetical protein